MAGDRGRHRPILRPLHDHGHRIDHDRDCRSHGADASGRIIDPGCGRQSPAHVHPMRSPHRGDGLGRPDAAKDHDARRDHQCGHGCDGDGLLDKRHHPSDRDGAAGWRAARVGRSRPHRPHDACDCQYKTVRHDLSDGGFLLCGRVAGVDETARRQARPFRGDCDRQAPDRWSGRGSHLERGCDPPAFQSGLS